jgi:predicted GIY-YIG superfamily endonuclease
MFIVYQLQLVSDKTYFGTTPAWRKEERLDEHHRGVGSKWTARFPPIPDPVVKTWNFATRDEAYAFENTKCEEWMEIHGINSCRGGLQNYGQEGPPYNFWVRPHLRHLIPIDTK